MVFSIPSYLGLGDRYETPVDERSKGYTFLVSKPKTGHKPDALFDKQHAYMYTGDRREDAETMHRREMLSMKAKNVGSVGYFFVGKPQKAEGLGSYYGCIDPTPIAHMPADPERRANLRRPTMKPRGMYTNRTKKGGYGYAHMGISDVGEDYIATYYDQPRWTAREEFDKWKQRMPPVPFIPAGHSGGTLDEGPATGASRCYTMTQPFRPKKSPPPMQHFVVGVPWRPAGWVDNKPTNDIEYWEDPYGGYDPRIDPKQLKKQPRNDVFFPTSRTDNFWYTQSVVFKRL